MDVREKLVELLCSNSLHRDGVSMYDVADHLITNGVTVQECIDEATTIDAVPVGRCRECIAYTPVDDNTGKCVFLIGKNKYVVPDGYCYLVERKEGADNG